MFRIYKKAGLLNKKKAETQYVVAKKGLGKSLILNFQILNFFIRKVANLMLFFTQPAHDVRTTLYWRRFNVLTSFHRPYNVVLTSCTGWVLFLYDIHFFNLLSANHEYIRNDTVVTSVSCNSEFLTWFQSDWSKKKMNLNFFFFTFSLTL